MSTGKRCLKYNSPHKSQMKILPVSVSRLFRPRSFRTPSALSIVEGYKLQELFSYPALVTSTSFAHRVSSCFPLELQGDPEVCTTHLLRLRIGL